MAALRAGAPGAFEGLVDRWRPRPLNFLRGLGADPVQADGRTQEPLIRVYRYRAEYRPDHPFTAFLFTLARRSFLDWRRRTSRWARASEPLRDEEPDAASVDADPAAALGE